jgi:predicted site-specific integrase-resolvase
MAAPEEVTMSEPTTEPYRTIAQASKLIGVPVYALRRAAKRGDIPMYRPFSGRWVVKLSEVEAAIRQSVNAGSSQ